MASSTLGQLGLMLVTPATATVTPFSTPARAQQMGARFGLAMVGVAGLLSISGYAHEAGANALRIITIMTQPPAAVVLYSARTNLVDSTFSFPKLPAGNYMVIDSMADNSRQAQVYDWVVAA